MRELREFNVQFEFVFNSSRFEMKTLIIFSSIIILTYFYGNLILFPKIYFYSRFTILLNSITGSSPSRWDFDNYAPPPSSSSSAQLLTFDLVRWIFSDDF